MTLPTDLPISSLDGLGIEPPLPDSLRAALGELAARPEILVALDFDGVLAPLVRDPDAARPLPASSAAIRRLATADGVRVALISGRTLADLRRLAQPPAAALLVGSHGAQFAGPVVVPDPSAGTTIAAGDPGDTGAAAGDTGQAIALAEDVVPGMDEQAQELLARVTAALDRISERHPGTFVERKPAGAALHTRQAARSAARRATEEALAGPSTWRGVHLIRGKEVVDLSVVEASKGVALTTLRAQLGLAPRSGGILYLGDDVTDERAFAALDDDRGDVTVKVGDGATIARHRIADPRVVATLLTHLAELRAR
jgi:trehalose-6-phosphatase